MQNGVLERGNMENLKIYNSLKNVPKEAQKKIAGGRLSGMTDIKPMWRIEKLTETFGPVGFGWKTVIKNKEIITGANEEKIAIVDIDLFVKIDDKWSEAIEGTGGSSFVAKEKNGLYTSDECYKMAYTDALSVACKALGMGADVYWGDSKYAQKSEPTKEDAENYVINFGKKHNGHKLVDVIQSDNKFIDWILNNSKDEYLLKCIELLTGQVKLSPEEEQENLDLLAEFEDLIIKTDTDRNSIYEHYKVKNSSQLRIEQLKEAVKIMKVKVKNE